MKAKTGVKYSRDFIVIVDDNDNEIETFWHPFYLKMPPDWQQIEDTARLCDEIVAKYPDAEFPNEFPFDLWKNGVTAEMWESQRREASKKAHQAEFEQKLREAQETGHPILWGCIAVRCGGRIANYTYLTPEGETVSIYSTEASAISTKVKYHLDSKVPEKWKEFFKHLPPSVPVATQVA